MRELFLALFLWSILPLSLLYGGVVKGVDSEVALQKIKNNLYKVTIPLNHENSSLSQIKLFGSSTSYKKSIPISNRWRVKEAKAYIKYTPSIALLPERSFLSVSLNDRVIRQFRLLNRKFTDIGVASIEVPLPVDRLEPFNEFSIQVFQHYLKSGNENMSSAPEVWTEIDIKESYTEFIFEMVEIDEKLSSISKYIFDGGNLLENRINYPLPDLSDETLYNYSFMSSSIGNILKYRKVSFSVTDRDIDNSRDNIVIGTTEQVRDILKRNGISREINDHLTIIRNPKNPTTAIIVIMGSDQNEIKKVLYSTTLFDLNLNEENHKNIIDIEIPEKAEPYSAPDFLPTDVKVPFKSLGYKTKSFSGYYAPPLELNFKLYPDLFFAKKSNVELNLNMLLPNSVKEDSILNIFTNSKYVTQRKVIDDRETQTLKELLFLDPTVGEKLPASLLKDGDNRISMQFKLIPFKDPKYTIHNSDNLQATISEESFFKLPEAKHWIEMADIKYFISSAYPYSIYPDLQDTALLLTDNRQESVETLMGLSFYLGKSIKYPTYYLSVSTKIDSSIEDKNLIVIGGYNPDFKELFDVAPLKIGKDGIEKEVSLFHRSFKNSSPVDEVSSKSGPRVKSTERLNSDKHLITQFYESPFSSKKSVLLFYSTGSDLYREVKHFLMPEYNSGLSGDVIVSKLSTEDKEIYSFDIGDSYFFGDLGTIDKSKFYISENPIIFTIFSLLSIIVFVYILRKSLLLYKARYHDDAD